MDEILHLRSPGMMIPLIPTNTGFPWCQSGAKWILSTVCDCNALEAWQNRSVRVCFSTLATKLADSFPPDCIMFGWTERRWRWPHCSFGAPFRFVTRIFFLAQGSADVSLGTCLLGVICKTSNKFGKFGNHPMPRFGLTCRVFPGGFYVEPDSPPFLARPRVAFACPHFTSPRWRSRRKNCWRCTAPAARSTRGISGRGVGTFPMGTATQVVDIVRGVLLFGEPPQMASVFPKTSL